VGDDEAERSTALEGIVADTGIAQLVPYFTQFIGEQVPKSLRSLASLRAQMRLADALLRSPHVHIEPYVRDTLSQRDRDNAVG
jgi:transcription initiation factor TFIID subunit 6